MTVQDLLRLEREHHTCDVPAHTPLPVPVDMFDRKEIRRHLAIEQTRRLLKELPLSIDTDGDVSMRLVMGLIKHVERYLEDGRTP